MVGPGHAWGQSSRVGALVPGHALGPDGDLAPGPPLPGLCRALPSGPGCPVPAHSPSLPCSLHHRGPCFPAVRRHLVFPHHRRHGVLCISALSEDPETQSHVSLHQLPHRWGAAGGPQPCGWGIWGDGRRWGVGGLWRGDFLGPLSSTALSMK